METTRPNHRCRHLGNRRLGTNAVDLQDSLDFLAVAEPWASLASALLQLRTVLTLPTWPPLPKPPWLTLRPVLKRPVWTLPHIRLGRG